MGKLRLGWEGPLPASQPVAKQGGLPGLQSPCPSDEPRTGDRLGVCGAGWVGGAHLDITGYPRAAHAAPAAVRQGCGCRAGGAAGDAGWGPGAGLAVPVLRGGCRVARPVQEVIKAVAAPERVGSESRGGRHGKGVRRQAPAAPRPILLASRSLLHCTRVKGGHMCLKSVPRGGRGMDAMTFSWGGGGPPLPGYKGGCAH